MPQPPTQSILSSLATVTATLTNINISTTTHHKNHPPYHPPNQHPVLPLPHPIYHTIGPKHRAEIQAWLEEHETDIGGLVFIFMFLLILGGLWRSRDVLVQWYLEGRRERARTAWVERERKRRRSVVVVGILRKGQGKNYRRGGGGYGGVGGESCGCGNGKVLKRVRFLDGLDETVVVVDHEPEERTEVLVDFLEDGRVVGEVF